MRLKTQCTRRCSVKKARNAFEATELSGKESENVDDWLYHFERVAVANGWSLEDRHETAPALLRGYASKWFRGIEHDENKTGLKFSRINLCLYFIGEFWLISSTTDGHRRDIY